RAPDPRRARVHTRTARVPRAVAPHSRHRRQGHGDLARRHAHARDRRQPHRCRSVCQRAHPGVDLNRTRRSFAALAAVATAVVLVAGCESTFDTAATTTSPTAATTTTTLPTGTTAELLDRLVAGAPDLSHRIVAGDGQHELL